jgi:hypothetical protein
MRTTGAALGFDYRSRARIGNWPLVHVCSGVDPESMRPRVARGLIAVGNIAVGAIAIGGITCGLATLGGLSLGLLVAVGGVAAGGGLSLGGVAMGSIALGGVAFGFVHAVGGVAWAPSVVSGARCDPATVDLLRRWLAAPPQCR